MKLPGTCHSIRVATALVVALLLPASAGAETSVGSDIELRVAVALRVPPSAAQAWLPVPWTVSPVPAGPFAGANLFLNFIDRRLAQDAMGRPVAGGIGRSLVLKVPASNPDSGESTPVVIRVYGPQDDPGPYQNSVRAQVRREASEHGHDHDAGQGSESWEVRDEDGRVIALDLQYRRSSPVLSKREVQPRSAVDPDVRRIYRITHLMDVVRSAPTGVDRVSDLELRSELAELDPLFDGSEEIVGVAVIPMYWRQIFLP